jgi:hypothetical protein
VAGVADSSEYASFAARRVFTEDPKVAAHSEAKRWPALMLGAFSPSPRRRMALHIPR